MRVPQLSLRSTLVGVLREVNANSSVDANEAVRQIEGALLGKAVKRSGNNSLTVRRLKTKLGITLINVSRLMVSDQPQPVRETQQELEEILVDEIARQ